MSIRTALAGAPSFAHLIGFGRTRAEDDRPGDDDQDDRKQGDDESDDDYAKRMKALDEKKEDEAKKAEEEDESKRAEDEEKKDEAARSPGKAEDDGDDARKAKCAEARGRLMERDRGAAIFGCRAAAERPDLAAQLAFRTSMSAEEAIGVLAAAAAGGRRGGVADRMANTRVPNVGADASTPAGDDPKSLAARIVAAGKKRRGEA